jgi:AGCS family alanine or glycine:cation symporter
MNVFLNKLMPHFLQVQEEVTKGMDERINDWFQPLADKWGSIIFYSISFTDEVKVPLVVIMLILSATIFTLVFKFVNIRLFSTAIQIVRGKYDFLDHHEALKSEGLVTKDGDIMGTAGLEGKHGEVSHFQALTAALSGTVGLGNIAGVAIAVSIGGPGATFWMIAAGLLGMSAKFVECTLGVKYRDIDENGVVYGGPMYYLSKGLASIGLKVPGKILAAVFAVMCIGGSFGGGNMFQANQSAQQFNTLFGIESSYAGVLFGIVMAVIVALVIVGGIKSIASVTERIVPFMVGMYMFASLIIIILHFGAIGEAFSEIFRGAFMPESIAGGIVGVLIQGFKRAAFSNESGIGSAAIAHSAVKTRYAASEGLVSLLEPFIDTVVVCTMTALVIVFCNTDGSIMTYGTKTPDGVLATSKAFATVFPWFPYLLTVAVILFAFSTMISWSYYGLQSWMYLFGKSKIANYSYKFIFCVFIVIGSASSLSAVTDFSDAMIFAMAIPNLIGCFLLLPKVKEELERYLSVIQQKRM